MKDLETVYLKYTEKLNLIEPSKIREAHKFLIDNYRSKILLTTDEAIVNFLNGKGNKWVNMDIKNTQFFISKPTNATYFRHESVKIKLDNQATFDKNAGWLVNKIAFYWTLFECFDNSDLEIFLLPLSKLFPIVIKSNSFKLNYPAEFVKSNVSYIGFYPRSGFGRSTEIGVLSLELYTNVILQEDKHRTGEFEMNVYYSDHTLSVQGEWKEEINQSVCFLRTTNDSPTIIPLNNEFKKEDKLNKLVLSQINQLC